MLASEMVNVIDGKSGIGILQNELTSLRLASGFVAQNVPVTDEHQSQSAKYKSVTLQLRISQLQMNVFLVL